MNNEYELEHFPYTFSSFALAAEDPVEEKSDW